MIAYTIVSRAYLAHARVLARSYAEHHRGQVLRVLLIDDVGHEVDDTAEPFTALRMTQLGMETAEVHRMAMLFGSRLIAAIKPWVFRHLLDDGHDAAVYIDSDIVVFDSLDPLAEAAAGGVVLVPHVLSPMPRDGCDPDETRILGVGQFNAGLFGTGVGDGGFLAFLQERLRRECRFDVPAMRVNEQRWLDVVPALFPCRVVRDPGVDVAYWNLHERPLARRDGRIFAGDAPLRCFHFSSFDPRMTTVAGRYEVRARPRVTRADDPLLDELCTGYAARLFEEGFEEVHRMPFAFDALPDGTPIYDSMRALYGQALAGAEVTGRELPPDPFDPADADRFGAWATEAYHRAGLPVPRLLSDGGRGSAAVQHRGSATSTVDWLGSLEVGPAAAVVDPPGARGDADRPKVVRSRPELAGFVVYGPRAQLDPGDYRCTVELAPGAASGAPGDDQALVAEVHIDGYVTGAARATFADLARGELAVDFAVPSSLAAEALLDGVELRVLSRGGVDVTIGGVLLECTHAEPSRQLVDCVLRSWLPFMAAAEAGRRSGDDLYVDAGSSGTVGYGPNWRLPEGRYVASMVLDRPPPAASAQSDPPPPAQRRRPWSRPAPVAAEPSGITDPTPFAVVEAVDGEVVLASRPISAADLGSQVSVHFTVTTDQAGPDDQIGIRIRTSAPFPPGAGTVIKAVTVEPDPAIG